METAVEKNTESIVPVSVSTNLDQPIVNLVPENSNNGDSEQKIELSPEEMRRIIEVLAATGKFWHDWIFLRGILSHQLKQVLAEYSEAQQQNALSGENYSELVKRLDEALLSFEEGPPFTLQRLCEILLSPKSTYRSLSKLALALEKNLLVTSTLTKCTDPYPTISSLQEKSQEINTPNIVPTLEIINPPNPKSEEINAPNMVPSLETINPPNPKSEINASNIVPTLETINPPNPKSEEINAPNIVSANPKSEDINPPNIVPSLEIINPNPKTQNGNEADNSVAKNVASDGDEEMPDAEPETEEQNPNPNPNPNPNISDVEMQDEEKVVQEEELKVNQDEEKVNPNPNDETGTIVGTVPVETGTDEQVTAGESVLL